MKEPALDPDAGRAAPNGLVLTFYHDQHLDVFGDSSMRRSMAPTEKKLRGGYCFSPALQPRFTFRGSNVVAIRNRLERSGILRDDPRPGQRGRVARF